MNKRFYAYAQFSSRFIRDSVINFEDTLEELEVRIAWYREKYPETPIKIVEM